EGELCVQCVNHFLGAGFEFATGPYVALVALESPARPGPARATHYGELAGSGDWGSKFGKQRRRSLKPMKAIDNNSVAQSRC
ncbi:MAG: hypothetical protein KBH45_04230, partial [Verrucomicrobia bacterium]|nr:hypothetical protein [Verrucomicrobiota bacterium]